MWQCVKNNLAISSVLRELVQRLAVASQTVAEDKFLGQCVNIYLRALSIGCTQLILQHICTWKSFSVILQTTEHFSGPSSSYVALNTYAGTYTSSLSSIESSGSSLTIHFSTDGSVTNTGFYFSYEEAGTGKIFDCSGHFIYEKGDSEYTWDDSRRLVLTKQQTPCWTQIKMHHTKVLFSSYALGVPEYKMASFK